MDMDRMDYLARDAHMTGLNMGFTNSEALIQCIRPWKSKDAFLLAYDESAMDYLEHLLYARHSMYQSCYEHPRKRAAERLFERLVKEVTGDDPDIIDDLYILTDDELLCALQLSQPKSELARRLLDQLFAGQDYTVIHQVQTDSETMSDDAKTWVKNVTKGKGKASYIDRPAGWEDAIARASVGADRAAEVQVIVAPPNAYQQQKFIGASILSKADGAYRSRDFFEIASVAKEALSKMTSARAKIKVMCPSSLSDPDKEKIRRASLDELGN
jgi:HD superfamily phosphohydrolase